MGKHHLNVVSLHIQALGNPFTQGELQDLRFGGVLDQDFIETGDKPVGVRTIGKAELGDAVPYDRRYL